MKRRLTRLFTGLLVFVLISVAAVSWLTLRASLPPLDGEFIVAGIKGTATIERDQAGLPTITAGSRADLAFATGFAHGQDRFFQIDLIRRQAAGELSAIIGKVATDTDQRHRFHRFRSRAQAAIQNLSAFESELLGSYAAGVNAGLASLRKKPFEYYLLSVEPEPWLAEDSVLVVYAMYMQLNDSRATRDIRRGLVHRVVPSEVYAWLYPQGTPWDAPLMGEARSVAALPAADLYSIRDYDVEPPDTDEIGKPHLNGSNNWAVGGALTTTGRAMVSNDMHLGLSTPNIYYRARLVATGDDPRDVTGVTLPGTPLLVAGSNGKVAWGYTNSYGDWTDAVVLRPGSAPNTYQTPDGDMHFDVYREVIDVKDGESIEMTIRETIWGPVNDRVDYPDGEIAVSWIAHKTNAVNLHLVDIETSDSIYAALDIANTMGIPPQNFVTGDADGNIAWTIAGKIPLKSSFNAMIPADWSVNHGWIGWLDPADYPRLINPEGDRIWTANARVTEGEALDVIGDGGYDLGARARQIRDSLFAKQSFEPADMLAIQYDDRALFLARWRELLLDVLDAEAIAEDSQMAEYRRLAQEWIPRAAPDSVGYRLVRAFRLNVQALVFNGLMAPVREAYTDEVRLRVSNQFEAPLWSLVTERPVHLLPRDYDSWRELLLESVQRNIRYFEDNYDGPLAERSWGERNTAAIQHPLSRAIPMLAGFLDMPSEPLNGDVDMPKAQGPKFGAAERFSVSPGDEQNGLMHMPSGQSGHPLSEFYRNGHDDWVRGRATPFLPGETRHTLTLTPSGG